MRKLILLFVLFISLCSFSQKDSIGNYKFKFKEYPEHSKLIKNEEWYKLARNTYVMYFSQSPIGIKKTIEHLELLLFKSDLKFTKPDTDKSFLSAVVKDLKDYEVLDMTIKNEMSEVRKTWNYNNEFVVFLFLKKSDYEISIMKLK